MHLALNFQRVDPARGGAETYVADLCRYLVQRRASGRPLCRKLGRRLSSAASQHRADRRARARTRLERIMSFARNSEAALRQANHDCSIGFVNTWAHDVIIPQGGVQPGQPDGQRPAISRPLFGKLYLLAKTANPKHWIHQFDRAQAVRPGDGSRGWSRSATWSNGTSKSFSTCPAADPRRAQRDRSAAARGLAAGSVRCAFRNRLGLEPGDLVGLFAGHNFALKGLKPL